MNREGDVWGCPGVAATVADGAENSAPGVRSGVVVEADRPVTSASALATIRSPPKAEGGRHGAQYGSASARGAPVALVATGFPGLPPGRSTRRIPPPTLSSRLRRPPRTRRPARTHHRASSRHRASVRRPAPHPRAPTRRQPGSLASISDPSSPTPNASTRPDPWCDPGIQPVGRPERLSGHHQPPDPAGLQSHDAAPRPQLRGERHRRPGFAGRTGCRSSLRRRPGAVAGMRLGGAGPVPPERAPRRPCPPRCRLRRERSRGPTPLEVPVTVDWVGPVGTALINGGATTAGRLAWRVDMPATDDDGVGGATVSANPPDATGLLTGGFNYSMDARGGTRGSRSTSTGRAGAPPPASRRSGSSGTTSWATRATSSASRSPTTRIGSRRAPGRSASARTRCPWASRSSSTRSSS